MTERTERAVRYYTGDGIVATGDSPDALEADAVAEAALMLARPAEALSVQPGYAVHLLPGKYLVPLDGMQAEAQRRAKPGHTLWALITVAEYLPDPPSRGEWTGEPLPSRGEYLGDGPRQAGDEGWVPE